MNDHDIETIKDYIADIESNLGPDEDFDPRLFLVDKEGEHTLLPIPPGFLENEHTSRMMLMLMAQAIRKKKAVECAFVSTSWRVEGNKKDGETVEQTAERLLHEEKAEEIVVMAICDRRKATVFCAPVERGGKHPTLGPWRHVRGEAHFSGLVGAIIPALNSSREEN